MGYLFMSISLLSGSIKGYCGKKTSSYVSEYKDAIIANVIRMFFCVIIGFAMILIGNNIDKLKIDIDTCLITLLSGVATSIFVVSWLVSVKKGAYMMLDVFLMLGILIPMIGCFFAFGEEIKTNQIIGIAILLIAVIIMCSYNNSIKEKITKSSFILLIICGLANGLTDFSQKLFVHDEAQIPVAVFNFYTYLFSSLMLIVFYFIFGIKNKEKTKTDNLKSIFGYILVMSLFLFSNSYFKTEAAKYIDSAQLYPLNQGASLIISSLMSRFLFSEKLTAKCITGLILAFIGLIIINVL